MIRRLLTSATKLDVAEGAARARCRTPIPGGGDWMRTRRAAVQAGVLLVAFSVILSACASVGVATPIEGCGDPNGSEDVKIGGVTDVGTLEDKSFNEAGWCGTIMGADAAGGQARVIVTAEPDDYAANIRTMVDNGFETIVTYGFAIGDATLAAS